MGRTQSNGPATGDSQILTDLLPQAAETGDLNRRAHVVARLMGRPVQQRDAHVLCDLTGADDDPALRATAAQVLGHHECAARFPEVCDRLANYMKEDPDLVAAKSIAFALRGTPGAWVAVDSDRPAVQVEGLLGVPLTKPGDWCKGFEAYFGSLSPEAKSVFLRRCQADESAADAAVEFLLSAELAEANGDPEVAAATLFQVLDQGALYRALTHPPAGITRTYREIWPGLLRRERREVLFGLLEEAVVAGGAAPSLVRAVAAQALEAAGSAAVGQTRASRTLLLSLGREGGRRLVVECQRLGAGASDGELRALVGLLTTILRVLPSLADEVEAVLGEWDPRVPGARLRAFHARLVAR